MRSIPATYSGDAQLNNRSDVASVALSVFIRLPMQRIVSQILITSQSVVSGNNATDQTSKSPADDRTCTFPGVLCPDFYSGPGDTTPSTARMAIMFLHTSRDHDTPQVTSLSGFLLGERVKLRSRTNQWAVLR